MDRASRVGSAQAPSARETILVWGTILRDDLAGDAQGDPVGEPRELSLDGDEVHVDALVIKFEDTLVTAGDALKGKALLLFRRIVTDRRRPADGVVLDREGQIPQSYAAERAPTAFERELWARFRELTGRSEYLRGVQARRGNPATPGSPRA